MKLTKEKIFSAIKKIISFLLNPRFILCYGISWLITNGWCYIFIFLGARFKIDWMLYAGSTYFFFLWGLPTPEKLITIPIAIFLLKRLFPNDQKTLAVLVDMQKKIKNSLAKSKAKHAEKKRQRNEEKRKTALLKKRKRNADSDIHPRKTSLKRKQ